jgi:hypothetical protein
MTSAPAVPDFQGPQPKLQAWPTANQAPRFKVEIETLCRSTRIANTGVVNVSSTSPVYRAGH